MSSADDAAPATPTSGRQGWVRRRWVVVAVVVVALLAAGVVVVRVAARSGPVAADSRAAAGGVTPIATMTANAVHLATFLKGTPYPAA